MVTLVGEAGLLLAATLAAIGVDAGPASPRRDVIVALLAAAMGLRNASVRRLAFPDLTTTVLTMTLTGLASDPLRGEGREAAVRRAAAVLAMLLGALAGAAAVLHGNLLLALVVLRRRRRGDLGRLRRAGRTGARRAGSGRRLSGPGAVRLPPSPPRPTAPPSPAFAPRGRGRSPTGWRPSRERRASGSRARSRISTSTSSRTWWSASSSGRSRSSTRSPARPR